MSARRFWSYDGDTYDTRVLEVPCKPDDDDADPDERVVDYQLRAYDDDEPTDETPPAPGMRK
jgi:hypothetical protein